MKAVFRNFLFLLKRFKIATFLNIMGLSMAFTAFIVMMIQVRFEYRFDRCHPNAGQIFRVDLVRGNDPNTILPRAFADAVIASSPHIREGCIITPINQWTEDKYVAVGDGDQSNGFKVPFMTCYPGITHIFGFQFTEGDPDCLKDPEKAIIPESMAQRMFGNESAVGKQLHLKEYIWTKGNKDLTIGGVYKDFPGNTQIENVVYTQIDNSQSNDWMSQNYLCYLLFGNKEEAAKFEANFNKTYLFILCVSFLFAVPVAYYAINGWLENFAYKTPVSWWGFALAGILVWLITVITVSVQSYKAATANPVNSLKTE